MRDGWRGCSEGGGITEEKNNFDQVTLFFSLSFFNWKANFDEQIFISSLLNSGKCGAVLIFTCELEDVLCCASVESWCQSLRVRPLTNDITRKWWKVTWAYSIFILQDFASSSFDLFSWWRFEYAICNAIFGCAVMYEIEQEL